MQYTNAQFRSILCGLGYLGRDFVSDGYSSNFPVSNDNFPLTGTHTRDAVIQFQEHYNIHTDGIVGPETMGKAAQVMRILQDELNRCVDAELPNNQPFYGPRTTAAVKKCQAKIGVKQDGIASLKLRVLLYNLVRAGTCAV